MRDYAATIDTVIDVSEFSAGAYQVAVRRAKASPGGCFRPSFSKAGPGCPAAPLARR